MIRLFESSRGEKPVRIFIARQESTTQAKILHKLDLLHKYGSRLGMPHSKQIEHDLYELRIRGKDEIRIFYIIRKETISLLHAFKKQTNKTPGKEIEIARERLKEVDRI